MERVTSGTAPSAGGAPAVPSRPAPPGAGGAASGAAAPVDVKSRPAPPGAGGGSASAGAGSGAGADGRFGGDAGGSVLSRERFEATERLAAAQEARVITTEELGTPAFTTRNAALLKPDGTTILFRVDVLVVLPPAKMPAGAQLQYKISDYEGLMRESTSQYWQDTSLDAGQHSFTLPVGKMRVQVRMITRENNRASLASRAYEFYVKGA
jgi:hypothetical protein